MQIGVDPGAVLVALVHDDLVRLVPFVLARPPQRYERGREVGRRFLLRQGALNSANVMTCRHRFLERRDGV